ncbi:1630_t:CDS:2 [Cetraspora pellucida]|uniref:1630_t:CDS:1 n=1 Tax=Cetraspora pellucida TaxID=1433469 RepID=A0A9N9IZJ2_9GLOM|nr:1630_t:CDS:2 [Cetraspora pellucida]
MELENVEDVDLENAEHVELENAEDVESENADVVKLGNADVVELDQLSVGISYTSWDLAEARLNSYAKATGFSLHRKRVTINNDGEVRRRTFECSHSGEPISNKVVDLSQQCNRNSKKVSCTWHVNLSKPKSSPVILVTSIVGEHNHEMQPDAMLYDPKYRKLSTEIIESIEFYVTKGNMRSKQILSLLTAKFPDHIIHKHDLYNAIQKFRTTPTQRHMEAQSFIKHLLQLKNQDPGWIVNIHMDPYDNSTFENDFYRRWSCLLEKYPQTQDYFNRTLQGCVKSWARFYQLKFFTAGVQSTQRIEVMNKLLKEGVKGTSSLRNLYDHIQNLLDNEAKWARHNSYLNSVPTNQAPSIVESVFQKVVEILKLYITPHILAVQQQQVIGSLLYKVQLRQKDDIQENTQLDYDNGFLEDELDRPQISIMALIKDIDSSEVVEIWEVMMNTKTAMFHIELVARRWYRDDQQDKGLEVLQHQNINISMTFQQNNTNMIYPDLHIIEQIRGSTYNKKNQQLASKKIKYANGFGKMKKALNFVLNLGCEEELISMITQFVDQKKSLLEVVNDPLVTKCRGRPPTKRLKSSSEAQGYKGQAHSNHAINPPDPNLRIPLSNISSNNSHAIEESKRKYVCNVCGKVGHNARTCK